MEARSGSNTRNEIIDAVKAFAIVCVVFGHCIQYGSGSEFREGSAFFDNVLFKAIYSFHMPLFMLLSGYLFGGSVKKRRWDESIKAKAAYLIVPILLWGLISTLITCFLFYKGTTTAPGFRYCIQTYSNYALTGLWFLWAVFYCSAVVAIVRHFFKDNPVIYVLGFVLSFFLPDAHIIGLFLYKYMYPFFIIGYFYNTRQISLFHKRSERRIAILVLILAFIVLFVFYSRDSYIYTSGHSILRDGAISITQLAIDLYRIIIGLTGSIIVILIIKALYPYLSSRVKDVLSYLGRNTLGIYILQGFLVVYILANVTKGASGFNVFVALVECLAVLVVSILILEVIKKSKLLRRLLLGG